MMKIAVSCVIDNSPKFIMQGWNWLTSLHSAGTTTRADIFVHHTPQVAREALGVFERLGAKLVEIEPFGEGPAVYCNKIRQVESDLFSDYDYTILSDADLFFVSCPTRLAVGTTVRAKVADWPNPPEPIWRELLASAGLADHIKIVPVQFQPGGTTFSTYFNGGLYVLPKASIGKIREKWPTWARYCLDQSSLLQQNIGHADQLGFGMTLLEGALNSDSLPVGENFPTHFNADAYQGLVETEVHAFHYHWRVDAHGYLLPVGIGWIDKQINAANRMLIDSRRQDFDNRTFWDFRYFSAPQLGSGLGSRGEALRLKQSLLWPYMKAISADSVLDVGCGDLEVMRSMPFKNYRGIDVSQQAIEIARTKRPDWQFDNADIHDIADNAYDYVICLDVLIHQPSAEAFREIVASLVRVARKGLIVSGYGRQSPNDGIVFTHLGLPEALQKCGKAREVVEIGSYRDVSIYLVLTEQGLPLTDADASLADVASGCEETADWQMLLELTRLSREQLGFFPKTISRTVEYPWFARRLGASQRGRVLDIGAGVSVLPLWLARQGFDVVTLDSSRHQRHPDNKSDRNELGYLDYGLLDTRIISRRLDAQSYQPEQPFDIVYSVSVIEHMPATVRRSVIEKLPTWLAPGGRILLSLDLTPGTDDPWPLSEGQVVDREQSHGTLHDIIEEMSQSGLRITEVASRRGIARSRTDIVFIEAARAACESAIAEPTARSEQPRQSPACASGELARVTGELARMTRERDAILQSTTWKATWIVRAGGSRMPRWARRSLRGGMKVIWWTVTFRAPRKLRERRIQICEAKKRT